MTNKTMKQRGLVSVSSKPVTSREVVFQKRIMSFLKHVMVAGVGLLFLFPFMWLVLTSFKSTSEIMTVPPTFFPKVWRLDNYIEAVNEIKFFRYAFNTTVIFVAKMIGAVLSCSMVAYGFSVLKWPGRDKIFVLVLATLMLPVQVTIIPLYIIYTNLDLIGTYLPLILPSWFGPAFFIFLFRQFFLTIPNELVEAARVDGCQEPSIYWKIIMPLAKPAIIAVILFEFMATWNDFMGPLIYLTRQDTWTLAIGLLQFQSDKETYWNLLMAASTLTVLPAIILYFFGQKYFIQGIATTGFK
jgi:multiple sugar transport system permease protein